MTLNVDLGAAYNAVVHEIILFYSFHDIIYFYITHATTSTTDTTTATAASITTAIYYRYN